MKDIKNHAGEPGLEIKIDSGEIVLFGGVNNGQRVFDSTRIAGDLIKVDYRADGYKNGDFDYFVTDTFFIPELKIGKQVKIAVPRFPENHLCFE